MAGVLDIFKSAPKPEPTGIFKMSPEFVRAFSGGGTGFTSDIAILKRIISRSKVETLIQQHGPHILYDYQRAMSALKEAKQTKLPPIFISSGLDKQTAMEVTRHEMIHAAHYANKQHPFFKEELKKTKSLSRTVNELFSEEQRPKARRIYSEYLRGQRKWMREAGKFAAESERLAYTYQSDLEFLKRAERAGIKTHLSINTTTAKRLMDAGEGTAIAKAGTAEVPAVLRATSRIIKSAL